MSSVCDLLPLLTQKSPDLEIQIWLYTFGNCFPLSFPRAQAQAPYEDAPQGRTDQDTRQSPTYIEKYTKYP